jgi:hypothetical protein
MINKIFKKCLKENNCLIWTKSLYGDSLYPAVYSPEKKKSVRGHRYVWTLINGNIPSGMVIMHTCDNPKCLNPDHLKLGTQTDNMRDCAEKRRFYNQNKTHCSNGHKYTHENTRVVKEKRYCRTCARLLMREKNGYNGFRKSKTDSSQFPGVSFESRQNKWSVRIKINEKYKRFGMFKTESEAIARAKEILS